MVWGLDSMVWSVKVAAGSMIEPYPTHEGVGPYQFLLTGDLIFKQHIL